MNRIPTLSLAIFVLVGCGQAQLPVKKARNPVAAEPETLLEARKGFQSKLVDRGGDRTPVPNPPANLFRLVKYDAAVGQLPAYLSPAPKDGKKGPAIIWITGGDCNSIDDGCWTEGPPANDQSASAYRKAGIAMMFPSLRGGNDNPGKKEGFLGEVDDVLAAADFLAKQDYVDPKRIYLGGHSTGGTLRLLVRPRRRRARLWARISAVRHFQSDRDRRTFAARLARHHQESDVRVRGHGGREL